MAVRALLIKPQKSGTQVNYVSVVHEPLGLLYLAAFVRKYSGHIVSVIDAQAEAPEIYPLRDDLFRMGYRDESLLKRIEEFNPQVVGITSLFNLAEAEVINIARLVKSLSRGIIVVVGGLDAGVRFEHYLHSGAIDLVVRGDGEETFLEILDCVDGNRRPTGIPGTCEMLDSGTARRNSARIRKIPFDEYPFPARDIVPRELYDSPGVQRKSFPFARENPAMLIQMSRGCNCKCVFCDIVSVQNKWIGHSVDYVLGEMEHCLEQYGTREFVFVDDNFMIGTEGVIELCRKIIDRGWKISFDILPGIAVWTLNEPMIDLMIKAGLYRACLPVESGNPQTLKFIRKPVDLDKTRRMIDYCNRKGLYTFANLLIGFPYETEDDIRTTFRWAEGTVLDAVNYFIATPMPGMSMYSIYKDNNWLISATPHQENWRTQHFTLVQLRQMAQKAARQYIIRRMWFYLNIANFFRYLWPKINSYRKLRYFLKITRYALVEGHRPTTDDKSISIFRKSGEKG